MSNAFRNGFSTLNRLLGKKNKNASNNDLTKSSSLSKSTTNLDTASQHNKIKPIAVSTKAPFEQTFRITVCLPLDQLYVARVGAKTKLADLLDMVCTNKLLDSNKFEFRHPVDDTQIFELDLTIGEVGLNEIRLSSKSLQANANEEVKYRQHQHTEYNRYSARPHTISASPYSSTTSLNSTDSSGINSSLRSNVPAIPCRKKRFAPRPPSQNSIPEDREQKCSANGLQKSDDDNGGVFKRPLLRQNFHVSSPNLTNSVNNNLRYSHSNGDSHADKTVNRSLSIYMDESKCNGNGYENSERSSENGNAADSCNHSRTSSDTSDIARDSSFGEPIPRKRLFVGKKKAAPSPPPRTISSISMPIATPRNILQKLTEEQPKDEEQEMAPLTATPRNQNDVEPMPDIISAKDETKKKSNIAQNVSKVMLNVDDSSIALANENSAKITISNESNENGEHVFTQKITQQNGNTTNNVERNVSRTQLNVSPSKIDQTLNGNAVKSKAISIVELNIEESNNKNEPKELSSTDQEVISKEINEIIEKAVEINEAKLISENNFKNKQDWASHTVAEINNNYYDQSDSHPESPLWIYTLPAPPTFADNKTFITNVAPATNGNLYTSSPKHTDLTENPIKPIITEKQQVDFLEYSDNSLPTSTVSTLETIGTTSTEPESLITSDIEDGYKGNDADNLKQEHNLNREQFIENEFEFLKEHLDSQSNQTVHQLEALPNESKNNIKKNEIVSKHSENHSQSSNMKITNGNGKIDVIDELTNIISTNRLDTVIKPNDENDEIDMAKQSSLANFQIGAYTNGNHENISTSTKNNEICIDLPKEHRFKRHSLVENVFNSSHTNDSGFRKLKDVTPKRISLTNGIDLNVDSDLLRSKQVNRSKSFHSTLSLYTLRNGDNKSNGSLLLTPRSNSYISLIGTQKYENKNGKMANGLLNESTRQKSTSELSIADSPSLQSLQVMKSILNGSRKNSLNEPSPHIVNLINENCHTIENDNKTSKDSKTTLTDVANKSNGTHNEIIAISGDEQKHTLNGNESAVNNSKTAPPVQPKTWKYQGPPAINLSTWGDRPKSEVFIKSDNDYKFGGVSKMAALQKRFSGITMNDEIEQNYEPELCKLPIVRGVEYKKNINQSKEPNDLTDSNESTVQLRTMRPSYEISRIVSDKPFSDKSTPYTTMTLGRMTTSRKNAQQTDTSQTVFHSINTNNTGYIQRNSSFNSNNMHAPIVKGFKVADIINSSATNGTNHSNGNGLHQSLSKHSTPLVKFTTYDQEHIEVERPSFTQFTLRKTGLKERILDECNNNNKFSTKNNNIQNSIDFVKNNKNPIPTAPKPPPPITQKPIKIATANSTLRSNSLPPPQIDPRNQLLDSIRNFNRVALKKN